MDGPSDADVSFGEFVHFEEYLRGDRALATSIAPQPALAASLRFEQHAELAPFPGSGWREEVRLLGDSPSDFGFFSGSESHMELDDPFPSPQLDDAHAEPELELALDFELQLDQTPGAHDPFHELCQEPELDPVLDPVQDTDEDPFDRESDQDLAGSLEPEPVPDDPESWAGTRRRRTTRPWRAEPAMSAQPGPSAGPATSSATKPGPSSSRPGPARQKKRGGKPSRKDRLLERNRASAKRYREKKKQWIEDTQSRVIELEEEMERKSDEIAVLKEESYRLQMELMQHVACGGPRIPALLEDLRLRRLSAPASTSYRMFSSLPLPLGPALGWPSPPSDLEPGSGVAMPSEAC
ncbi:hypothetical protein VTJ83DRAFT_5864 [Remersonia thermophila]|uniref:BZIP domain-containing protein n=1 Tax=Remersonia thermophila TaxID=72144 RepID=A0ABR4D823_9PEZI